VTIFGPIISDGAVEAAFTTTLQTWISTYLAEAELQNGLAAGVIPRPRSWNVDFDTDAWPEDQQPSIMVVCDGTGDIERRARGVYDAWFDVRVGCLVSARDRDSVRTVAQLYTAAISALAVQKGSLGGVAQSTVFLGRTYTFPDEDNRTLRLGIVAFRTLVTGVLQANAGPVQPVPIEPDPATPGGSYPTYPSYGDVQSVDTEVLPEQ
jgi:hypothetical protein